jgi:hypothetical protein
MAFSHGDRKIKFYLLVVLHPPVSVKGACHLRLGEIINGRGTRDTRTRRKMFVFQTMPLLAAHQSLGGRL